MLEVAAVDIVVYSLQVDKGLLLWACCCGSPEGDACLIEQLVLVGDEEKESESFKMSSSRYNGGSLVLEMLFGGR